MFWFVISKSYKVSKLFRHSQLRVPTAQFSIILVSVIPVFAVSGLPFPRGVGSFVPFAPPLRDVVYGTGS